MFQVARYLKKLLPIKQYMLTAVHEFRIFFFYCRKKKTMEKCALKMYKQKCALKITQKEESISKRFLAEN